MGALTSSANSVTYMRDKTFAEWVALNQIATLRLQMTQGQAPPVGNTTGDLEFAARSWHWRQDVVKTQVQGIVRVDLKVRPKELKAGDDDSWYVTVSGLVGDSVGAAAGATAVDWDAGGTSSGLPGQTNPGTSLGGSGTPGNSNTGTGTTGSGSTTTTPNTRPQSGSPTQ
jgi:type II secretion system protein I